jgi:NAD(P)H dehydrogenase (quinone)
VGVGLVHDATVAGASSVTPPIVVTGVTGRLGGRVALRLSARGLPLRIVVRDPDRAPDLPDTQVIRAHYDDADALHAAFVGAHTVFMVSAAEHPERLSQHLTAVDALVLAGVRHVVYTSFVGASETATFTLARDHWATEQKIRDSGLEFTFLRDNLYADLLPLMVGDDGVLRGPAGDGRVSFVTQDDIADAAVGVISGPQEHAGETYDLTGPDALTLTEAAYVLSRSRGRTVAYQDQTVEEAYASRRQLGAPDWQLDAWVSTYTAIRAGELAGVSNAVERLAGHPATSLESLLAPVR